MEKSTRNETTPHLRFEVEKVIGVSSDGNYQVQWAPAWVSKFHLVGCEHLIQEFLQRQIDDTAPNITDIYDDKNERMQHTLASSSTLKTNLICTEDEASDDPTSSTSIIDISGVSSLGIETVDKPSKIDVPPRSFSSDSFLNHKAAHEVSTDSHNKHINELTPSIEIVDHDDDEDDEKPVVIYHEEASIYDHGGRKETSFESLGTGKMSDNAITTTDDMINFRSKELTCTDYDRTCTTDSGLNDNYYRPTIEGIDNSDEFDTVEHTGLKQFTCDMCDFSTNFSRSLRRHKNSVHKGVKPFHCPACEYCCSHKHNLLRHVKTRHPDFNLTP